MIGTRNFWSTLVVFASLGAGCGEPASAPSHTRIRYGEFMPELGRRFETLGRAVKGQRYELAAYEAHEMQEVFADDFPRAAQPSEVKNDLRPLGDSFGSRFLAPIIDGANAKDADRLGAAYRSAAAACNACHQAAGKAFIEVSPDPGLSCPRVEQ